MSPDDVSSTTEFRARERHGRWHTFEDDGGCSTEGQVEHGLPQGEWIDPYRDGEQFRAFYRDGTMMER